ncbi:hypothetical protein CHS0354_009216 [Potamilus streckersoni]|uniref:Protein aurora borealis n=1 Tax=Potamilus streckersoni TaxID=2493646 RepID=A0AAE0SZ09_9BIVA|nr:hypothetical protein CHS0354_009216 [Potamilus streckersoni]
MENEGESCPPTDDVPLSPLGPPRQRTPSGSSTRHIFFDPNISPIQNPSPAQKKLTGVSSNARNDIYLRTLVNSPYHKSFTPLSSTSCGLSPAFRTPVRNKEPNAEPTSTPQEICQSRSDQGTPDNPQIHHESTQTLEDTRRTQYASQIYRTPQNQIQNPFDSCMIERLHMPTFMSPGVFSVTSNPDSEEKKPFRWSIEHLAVLNPADIEEMPHQQDAYLMHDKDVEEKVQRAIDQFFANHMIAPSPWSDDKKKAPKTTVLQPGSEGQSPSNLAHLEGSIQKQLPQITGTQEVACQTLLSLPVNFDLQKALGTYMTQDTDEDAIQEVLSTSSLRRKLFFNADTSSLAPSPGQGVHCDDEPVVSPPLAPPMTPKWENQTPLKNTPAFASSPIKIFQTPKQKMHLSDTDFLASPELSPIVHGYMQDKGSLRKSHSYGVFATHLDGSFEISSGHDAASGRKRHTGDAQQKDLVINSPPVSPIPSFRLNDLEETSDHSLSNSPGVSPIHPSRMSVQKSSHEVLYLDTSRESGERRHSSDDSSTPVSKNSHLHSDRLKGSLPKAKSFSTFRDLGETTMDYEITPKSRHIQFADNILTSSVYDTLQYSMSDLDYPNETNVPPSQDTGYQTASLQSTNQDTGQHTNLTGQFSSFPFNITSQEYNFHSSSQSSSERPLPALNFAHTLTNLSAQDVMLTNFKTLPNSLLKQSNKVAFSSKQDDSAFSDDSHEISSLQHTQSSEFKEGEENTIDEEAILQRARQVLVMANNLYPQEIKQMGLTEQNITPTIATTWLEPLIASTPQKKLNNYLMKQKEKGYGNTASEIAASILKKAGEDLAKYGSIIECD